MRQPTAKLTQFLEFVLILVLMESLDTRKLCYGVMSITISVKNQ